MKKLSLLLLLLSLLLDAGAQTQKQWLKHADRSFEEKDFYGASLYYRKAMLVDSSNLYVVHRYAESLRLYNEYKLAEHYYGYVYRKDRSKGYPESLFWLAMMQKNNAKYIDARRNFIQFKNSYKQESSYYYLKASQEIKSCEFAQWLIKNPQTVNVYNLGDSINSVDAEFGALRLNDSTLYFSSPRSESIKQVNPKKDAVDYTKIYEAEKIDTLWKVKQELNSVINTANFHNANGSFSNDGSSFYFTRCDDLMQCAIYKSELREGIWQEAKKLNEKINLEGYISTHPSISSLGDKEILFFVSNRPEGKGKLDIWFSLKDSNDFSDPINAGGNINTLDDDVSPWFDDKNKILYFSSSWHYGLGGQDIFKSITDSLGFSKPVNLGYPVNSSVNDLYFTFDSSSRSGFITSNRKGSIYKKGETCCNDLWHFQYYEPIKVDTTPVVKVNPLDEFARFIPVKLYFHNDEPNPRSKDTLTALNYLSTHSEYIAMIELYKEHYSKGLEGEKKQAAQDSIQSFFENHVNHGVRELEAFTEVLLRQLDKGYKLDLTVRGHASSLAKTDYNVNLTLRRISSLENFLREYKGGVFIPYLTDSASNGGHLKIIKIPFGEYKANEYLSDNLNDKKNSVYSISAALHRNIEIVSVSLEHKDSLSAQFRFRKEIYDFGAVKAGAKMTHRFKFKNTGKSPLIISSISSECSCITTKGPEQEILPGQHGEIEIVFDSANLIGKVHQTIFVNSNAVPALKELSITAEIR